MPGKLAGLATPTVAGGNTKNVLIIQIPELSFEITHLCHSGHSDRNKTGEGEQLMYLFTNVMSSL